jgi:hypothetical protein
LGFWFENKPSGTPGKAEFSLHKSYCWAIFLLGQVFWQIFEVPQIFELLYLATLPVSEQALPDGR